MSVKRMSPEGENSALMQEFIVSSLNLARDRLEKEYSKGQEHYMWCTQLWISALINAGVGLGRKFISKESWPDFENDLCLLIKDLMKEGRSEA